MTCIYLNEALWRTNLQTNRTRKRASTAESYKYTGTVACAAFAWDTSTQVLVSVVECDLFARLDESRCEECNPREAFVVCINIGHLHKQIRITGMLQTMRDKINYNLLVGNTKMRQQKNSNKLQSILTLMKRVKLARYRPSILYGFLSFGLCGILVDGKYETGGSTICTCSAIRRLFFFGGSHASAVGSVSNKKKYESPDTSARKRKSLSGNRSPM